MDKYEGLTNKIAASPELSDLLLQTVEAVKEFVEAHRSRWKAEITQLSDEALKAGKLAFGVPLHAEKILVDSGCDDALSAFLIAQLYRTSRDTRDPELVRSLSKMRDDYRDRRKGELPLCTVTMAGAVMCSRESPARYCKVEAVSGGYLLTCSRPVEGSDVDNKINTDCPSP